MLNVKLLCLFNILHAGRAGSRKVLVDQLGPCSSQEASAGDSDAVGGGTTAGQCKMLSKQRGQGVCEGQTFKVKLVKCDKALLILYS